MGTRFKCNEETTVQTKQGLLKGFYYDGIYAFHGIRYARAKRFMPPAPPRAWEGVRDALSYGYICPILNNPKPTGEVATPHRFWPENEHCQYLNIWTPSLDASGKRPVLVWLHGGGFFSGSSIEQVCYDGANLADFGDAVVVTLNHRLNVFGFLDLSDFGERYSNSVNAGIADIVAALEWVRDNIAAFGGNPDNVTVFGQSGGGSKVTALGQTEAARGLFSKAVVMSGVYDGGKGQVKAGGRELVLEILKQLGLGADDVAALETVPSRQLIDAVNKAEKALNTQGKSVEWGPKANHWYAGDPLKVGFSEFYKTIPTMVGTVLGEFNMEPPVEGKDALTAEERLAVVAQKYGEENAKEVVRRFKEAYPDKNEVDARCLDLMFRPDSLKYIQKKASEGTAPVYAYMFTVNFDFDGGKLAWHCSDIPFWFHNTELIPVCQIDGVTETLEYQMSAALINFARTANPNVAGLPWWEPCTKEHTYTMILDRTCELRTDHEKELIPYMQEVTPPFVFDPSVFDEEDEAEGKAWFY